MRELFIRLLHRPSSLLSGRCLTLTIFPVLIIVALSFFFVLQSRGFTSRKPFSTVLIDGNGNRREAIKSAFDFAWNGYYRTAFPHDELMPVSNSPGYSRNDWGATAVDALGTAILMEKTDIVQIVLAHIKSIDFRHTDTPISVFESTIRYMGGLLSAFELLNGPFASMNVPLNDTPVLLDQARALGDVLSAAFIDGNSLPSGEVDPHSLEGIHGNNLAGAGTLVLEWTKLSDLIEDPKYAQLAQKSEDVLLDPRPKMAEPFPGLVGTVVDVHTGLFEPGIASWGGSSDSFYEYLLKIYMYDTEAFATYKERWVKAAESTIKHLASSPAERPDIIFLGQHDGEIGELIPISGHMECFAGGNFLLGGFVLNETRYTDFGLKLIHGCHHTYVSTATRIGPEKFMWVPSECGKTTPAWKCDAPPSEGGADDFNSKSGFWITESSYNLRPKVIESYYYAYRMTRDEKYREWAWDAWQAIDKNARLERGYNYLRDVNAPDGANRAGDNQESYFFSETLKYLFLIFSDDSEWHVKFDAPNHWVYNTEGHPFKVRR